MKARISFGEGLMMVIGTIDEGSVVFVFSWITHLSLCSQVCAKHEEKSPNKTVYREYNREFMLPAGTNPELIKSSLSKDGVLTIDAPLPAIENYRERTIPIDKC